MHPIQSNANDTIAKLREEVRQARSQVAKKGLQSNEPPKEVLGLRKKLAAVDSANATLVKDFRALQVGGCADDVLRFCRSSHFFFIAL